MSAPSSSESQVKQTEGWIFLPNCRKAHWFDASGRAKCGNWLTFSSAYENSVHRSPDDCKACWKRLDKEAAKRGEPDGG